MNGIAITLLSFLALNFLLHFISDRLNLKALHHQIPPEFKGIYDAHAYQRSQDYLKENTRFKWVASVFDFLVLLIFWFGKGFFFLDQWVRGFGMGPVLTGLVYMGLLLFAKALLMLPFQIWETFIIEEKFGFNKTTGKTFVLDWVKIFILAVLIGAPLMAGVFAFFAFAGANAWWLCWICLTLFMVLVQFVAPAWIMPLFNQYTPLGDGKLKTTILDYATSIDFPLENVQVMDGSKRSGKSNAFFTGFGKHKKIVLFDTLLANHDNSELLAILAHEMGHYKLHHIRKMMIIGILHMGLMLYILSWFISNNDLFKAFYVDTPSVYAGFIFFSLLYAPIDFFASIVLGAISRRHEYQADQFAVQTTGYANSLVTALKKISVHNLSNLTPHPLHVFLHHSHPPILARIRAMAEAKSQSQWNFS